MAVYSSTEQEINTVTNEEKIARKIEEDFHASDVTHKSKKDKFKEYERDFLAQRDDQIDAEFSNTYIPKIFEAIRGILAFIEQVIFSSRPFAKAIARSGYKSQNETKVSKIVDYQLDHGDFEEQSDLVFQDSLVYGSCPYLKIWESETGLVPRMEQVFVGIDTATMQPIYEDILARDENGDVALEEGETFDGYRVIPIRIYDWFPPAGADSHFVERWPYAMRRYWATKKQLEDAGIYKNLDRINDAGSSDRSTEEYTIQQREDFKLIPYAPNLKEYECIEYYTDQKIYAKVRGTSFLIRNDSNQYLKKPVGVAMIFPKKDSPWGIGLIEICQLLARTYNNLVDNVIDESNIQSNKPVVISEDVDWSTINQGIRQRQIVKVASGVSTRDAITFVPSNDVIPSAFNLIGLFGNYLQSALAFTDLAKGLPQSGDPTATEVGVQAQNLSNVIKLFVKNLARTYGKNVFRDCLRYCQLFITAEKEYRILGEQGSVVTVPISPSEILGDFDFRFDWESREVNSQIQVANISNFMQSLNQIQTFTPIHGLLVESQLRNFNIWDKEKIEKAVKDTFDQMQQVQAMQAKTPTNGTQASAPNNPITELANLLSNVQSSGAPNVQAGVPNA